MFRVAVTLKEPVDPELLSRAAADLQPRFPTIYVKLKSGFFWYYLENIPEAPKAEQDYAYPLTHMPQKQLKKCLLFLKITAKKNFIIRSNHYVNI